MAALAQLLHYPHLWIAVVANFCNVGAQISSWSSLIPVHEAVHDSERTDGGGLPDGYAGGADGRAVCVDSADEVRVGRARCWEFMARRMCC